MIEKSIKICYNEFIKDEFSEKHPLPKGGQCAGGTRYALTEARAETETTVFHFFFASLA